MFLFIESIRILDGKAENLARHQARVAATFARYFPGAPHFSLENLIRNAEITSQGLVKMRIIYNRQVQSVEFQAYHHPHFEQFALVEIQGGFSYPFKFANRTLFDTITTALPGSVLPLLVQRGRITDSSFTNLIFSKNKQWFSPATPLLAGTRLKSLVASGKVQLCDIHPNDITSYDAIIPINSMNQPGEAGSIHTGARFHFSTKLF